MTAAAPPVTTDLAIAMFQGRDHVLESVNAEFRADGAADSPIGAPVREAFPHQPRQRLLWRAMDRVYRTAKLETVNWGSDLAVVVPRWQDGEVVGVATALIRSDPACERVPAIDALRVNDRDPVTREFIITVLRARLHADPVR